MKLYPKLLFILLFLPFVLDAQPKSIQELEKELSVIDSTGQTEEWIAVAFDLAYEYDYEARTADAQQLYQQAQFLAKRKELTQLYQAAIIWQARLLFYEGQQNESLGLLYGILNEIAEDDIETRAWALRFIGSNNVYLGNYAKAYEAQIEALDLYDKLGEKEMIVRIKYNIGNNFTYQEQYDLALKNFREALTISKEIDLPFGQMQALQAIGNIYADMDSVETAFEYYEKTILLADEMDDIITKGWTLVNLAATQQKDNSKLAEAKNNIDEALKIATETDDLPLKGFALEELAKVFTKMKRYNKALEAVEGSYDLAKEMENRSDYVSIYNTFAEVYYAKGDFENYKKYINKHIELKDDLFSEKLLSNMTNLRKSYEIQEVEQAKRLEILEKDKAIRRVQLYLLIAGGLIFLLIVYMLYLQVQNQREKNQLLKQKNAQITKQNEALALTNQDLEKYAYAIAHDLREPLRNISGFTTLINRKLKRLNQGDEDLDDYSKFVVDNTNQMSELLESLLKYSKLATENQILETVNCNEVLKEVVVSQGDTIAEHQVEIVITELPTIIYNQRQFFDILDNLIENAIKYRKTEVAPKIIVDVKEDEMEYTFAVRDNGIGIESQYFEKIFVVFQRLHERGKYKGVGVGLAMCKKIIESRGGKIWINSVLGEGSTFYFTIPKTKEMLS